MLACVGVKPVEEWAQKVLRHHANDLSIEYPCCVSRDISLADSHFTIMMSLMM